MVVFQMKVHFSFLKLLKSFNFCMLFNFIVFATESQETHNKNLAFLQANLKFFRILSYF